MSRRWDRVARGATGVAVLGVVGAVAAFGSAPAADPADPPAGSAASEVRVPAASRTLVCPGPLALPDDATAGDAAFDPTPGPTVTTQRVAVVPGPADDGSGAGPGAGVGAASLTPVAGGGPLLSLDAGPGAAVGGATGVVSATVLAAEPADGRAPTAGGASASVTAQGDLRGLAAASCRPPSAGLWLVGGSTEIGSSALLVVANPGRTPAEVTVAVYGPSGPVETPGATFLVAPGAERALLLEGVAAEQRRLAVHVTAAGGLVSAHVQDSRLDGFTPAGIDLVTAGAAPSTRQVVAGLAVPASEVGQADAAQVRLLATGDRRTTVTLTLLGPDGPVTLPGAERLELGPGEVTDVSLAGLPAGGYTAVVEASDPVVAGAMLTRPGPPVDLGDIPTLERAWVPASEPGEGGVVAVPDGVPGVVAVVGDVPPADDAPTGGVATGTLRVLGTDGEVLAEEPLRVPTGSSAVLDVAGLAGGRPVGAVQVLPADAAGPGSEGSSASTGAGVSEDAGRQPQQLVWAVVASVGGPQDELLSVLTAVPRPEAGRPVEVRPSATLGLP